MATRTAWERVEAGGTKLLDTLKRLVNQGNVHKVRIRQGDRTVAEFPLTVGVVGAVFAPVLAAIGAITALMTDCAIEVQRDVVEAATPDDSPASTEPPDVAEPAASTEAEAVPVRPVGVQSAEAPPPIG